MTTPESSDLCEVCSAELGPSRWPYVDTNGKRTCPKCSGYGVRCSACGVEMSLVYVPRKCPSCRSVATFERL